MNETTQNARRYDLDWLRVIAFGILIYFHAAVAFLPSGLPMTINAEPSEALGLVVGFLHQFRLALLFFVSGCGVFFALKSRDRQSFFKERSKRLLIPIFFGMLVLVPFMVYLEKLYLGAAYDSFIAFYSGYFTNGIYPDGNLSWHHFWFLAYLYLFCLVAWPIFKRLQTEFGKIRLQHLIHRFKLNSWGVYLIILPMLIVEIVLRPLFPGFRNLIQDWASFSQWFMVFIAGYVFAFDRSLLDNAKKLRHVSLLAGCVVTYFLFSQFWHSDEMHLYPFEHDEIDVFKYLLFSTLRVTNVWLWILVSVGFAAYYLNKPSSLLTKLNKAVYPVFCLHLPVLVALEFVILPTEWSISAKFLVISNAAVVILALLFFLLKPIKMLHPLLGFKS